MTTRRQQIMSGLLGLAVGDALGVPVEGERREDLARNPVKGMSAFGSHSQPAGTWSDDTSLTLATVDSLIERGDLDLADLAERFVCWLDRNKYTAHGYVFDVGGITARALALARSGTDPYKCGLSGERDNGNGSLMRILPVAIRYANLHTGKLDIDALLDNVHRASRLTHAHPVSLMACGLYSLMVVGLLSGKSPLRAYRWSREAGERYYQGGPWDACLPKFKRYLSGALYWCHDDALETSGYVLDTLEASVWCLLKSRSYRGTVLKAVNLGHDADTTGAVTGGLAGLVYSVPPEWIKALARTEYVRDLCARFADGVLGRPRLKAGIKS